MVRPSSLSFIGRRKCWNLTPSPSHPGALPEKSRAQQTCLQSLRHHGIPLRDPWSCYVSYQGIPVRDTRSSCVPTRIAAREAVAWCDFKRVLRVAGKLPSHTAPSPIALLPGPSASSSHFLPCSRHRECLSHEEDPSPLYIHAPRTLEDMQGLFCSINFKKHTQSRGKGFKPDLCMYGNTTVSFSKWYS